MEANMSTKQRPRRDMGQQDLQTLPVSRSDILIIAALTVEGDLCDLTPEARTLADRIKSDPATKKLLDEEMRAYSAHILSQAWC